MSQRPGKALFLDRDGVINVDHGYVWRPEEFEFLPGIFDLVRAARAHDYRIVIVTNQSGIGRGYYSEEDFQTLTQWMKERFAQEQAAIDAVFHCPYHPEAPTAAYRQNHPWRKPAPGMLLAAAEQLATDLASSIFIGDKETDVQAGHAAGIGTMLLFAPDAEQGHSHAGATGVIRSLTEAEAWLVNAPG